jgi:hypothetical protein
VANGRLRRAPKITEPGVTRSVQVFQVLEKSDGLGSRKYRPSPHNRNSNLGLTPYLDENDTELIKIMQHAMVP